MNFREGGTVVPSFNRTVYRGGEKRCSKIICGWSFFHQSVSLFAGSPQCASGHNYTSSTSFFPRTFHLWPFVGHCPKSVPSSDTVSSPSRKDHRIFEGTTNLYPRLFPPDPGQDRCLGRPLPPKAAKYDGTFVFRL